METFTVTTPTDTATAPTSTPDATPATPAPWYGELPEDLADSRSFFDQFKDRDSFLKSAKETKAALSRKLEGFVKLPGETATPEELASFRQALGIPETPDGYEVQVQVPEGMAWDETALTPFKELAHAEGIPPKAFAALVQKQAEVEAQMFQEQQAALEASQQALVNEWGDQYDYRLSDIQGRVGDALDLSQPFLSREDVLRALDSLAKDFRPDDTNPGKVVNSGASLDDQIREIQSSPAYRNTMDPGHKAARARLHSLYAEQARREAVPAR